MGDLISRSALIELIKSHDDITLDRFSELAVCRVIREQPTAYDVEKVVAELEELPIHFSEGHWGEYIDKENTINIVKRGGVDGKE